MIHFFTRSTSKTNQKSPEATARQERYGKPHHSLTIVALLYLFAAPAAFPPASNQVVHIS